MADDNRVYAVPDTVIFKNWVKAKPEELMTRRLLLRNGSSKSPFRVKVELPRSTKFKLIGTSSQTFSMGYEYVEIEANGTAAFTVQFRRLPKEEDTSPCGNWQDYVTVSYSGKKFDVHLLAVKKGDSAKLETFVPERRELDKLMPGGVAPPDSRLQSILKGAMSPPKVLVDEQAFEDAAESIDPAESELINAAEKNRQRHAEMSSPPLSPVRESAELRRSQMSSMASPGKEETQPSAQDTEYDYYRNLLQSQVKKLRGVPGEGFDDVAWKNNSGGSENSTLSKGTFNPLEEGIVFKRDVIEEETDEAAEEGEEKSPQGGVGYGLSLSDDEERMMADLKVPGVVKPKKRTKSPPKVEVASPPREKKLPDPKRSPTKPLVEKSKRAISSPRFKKSSKDPVLKQPEELTLEAKGPPIKDITPSIDPLGPPVFVINGVVCDSRGREIGSVNGDVTVEKIGGGGPQTKTKTKTKALPAKVSALPQPKKRAPAVPQPLTPKEQLEAEDYFDSKIQQEMPARLIHKEVVKIAKKPPVAPEDNTNWDTQSIQSQSSIGKPESTRAVSEGRPQPSVALSAPSSQPQSGTTTPRTGATTPMSRGSSLAASEDEETKRLYEEQVRLKEEAFARERDEMMSRIKELEMKVSQDQAELDEMDGEAPLSAVEQAKAELVFGQQQPEDPKHLPHAMSYHIDDDDEDYDPLQDDEVMDEYRRRVEEARSGVQNSHVLKRESSIPTLPPVTLTNGMASDRSTHAVVTPHSARSHRGPPNAKQSALDRLTKPTKLQQLRKAASKSSVEQDEQPEQPHPRKKSVALSAVEKLHQSNWDALE